MEWIGTISHLALWVAVLTLAFLLLGVLRKQGLLSWQLAQLEATTPSRIGRSGIKPGAKAPEFTLADINGHEISLSDFAGRKVLLVFVQAGCGPCHDVAPELNRLAASDGNMQVLVVNYAKTAEASDFARDVNAQFPVLVQEKLTVSKRYEVFATPFAFLIDESGIVTAKGLVSCKEHLGYLLANDKSVPSAIEANEEMDRDEGESQKVSLPALTEVHHA